MKMNNNLLNNLYYNPATPGSFSSVKKLSQISGVSTTEVQKWLEGEDAYTLHKQVRKKFPRNRYHVTNIDDLFQADLVDMRRLKEYNDSVCYLLTVIDVFSKYAWVKPLKSKTGNEVVTAFQQIFNERVPLNITTDKGKEFTAGVVQKLFKKYDINFYVTKNPDTKAAVIERFNRTLKTRMFKYFTYKNCYRYVDVLQDFVRAYNHSYHRTIKMSPVKVNSDNILEVYNNTYSSGNVTKNQKVLYNPGDYVRIVREKHVFEKGYESSWSREIFKITDVIRRNPVVYKICDLQEEPIDGVFYQQEIQRVKFDPDALYQIEKILKKRYKNGKREVFVQWKNYPSKFNSWVAAESLAEI